MRIVAVIQARMASTRLPGKVLLDIGGESMLSRVVRRTQRAELLAETVVATTLEQADEAIVEECQKLGVPVFRGDEQDVLDRYYQAALAHDANVVVRITSDCPLVDPGVVDEVVNAFLRESPDYASNSLVRTYPRGLDTEVMQVEALARAWREARKPYHRIHVTPYIYENGGLFRLLSVTGKADYSELRWTVDTPEDLDFVRAVYARLLNQAAFSWRDVLQILVKEPELTKLNRHVKQKVLEEG